MRHALPKIAFVVIAALLLSSCGGGGGGGSGGGGSTTPPPTSTPVSFTGSVAAISSVSSAPPEALVAGGGSPPMNMLLPPSAPLTDFPAISQAAQYTFSASSLGAIKVTAANFPSFGLSINAYMRPTIGVNGYAADPTLGQLTGISLQMPLGVGISPGAGTLSVDNSGAQPTVLLTQTGTGFAAVAGYALPLSAMLNPAGFTYQTFGGWSSTPGPPTITDGFFSAGVPTTAGIPVTGTASYSGQGQATFIDAVSGDPADVTTTVTAQVDFQTLTVTISTTATAAVSSNAPGGTARTPNPALNLSGVLHFPVATNTFVGTVTSTNGMSGNVTGRFYGTPIVSATGTKVAGSPPEIGGTFAVLLPGVGSMQGSFGAQ